MEISDIALSLSIHFFFRPWVTVAAAGEVISNDASEDGGVFTLLLLLLLDDLRFADIIMLEGDDDDASVDDVVDLLKIPDSRTKADLIFVEVLDDVDDEDDDELVESIVFRRLSLLSVCMMICIISIY
ncbi:hypothetical protein BCR42DRAFT_412810, partial [Absidia repens]